jgi:hypothetical protein
MIYRKARDEDESPLAIDHPLEIGVLIMLPKFGLTRLGISLLTIALVQFPLIAQERMHPLTRDHLRWLNQQGGEMDRDGYYSSPIDATQFYGVYPIDGFYYHAAGWDDTNSAPTTVLEVRDGKIVRMDYQFPGR